MDLQPAQNLEQVAVQDNEWSWPQYPRGAPRNDVRGVHDVYVGWEGDWLYWFAASGNQLTACREAHVSVNIVTKRRKNDVGFQVAFEEARQQAVALLEAAAWRRAATGVTRTKYVYQNGQQIATETITEYSDTLLIFLLKANDPQKYRETVTHEHNLNLLRAQVDRLARQEGIDPEIAWAEARQLVAAAE